MGDTTLARLAAPPAEVASSTDDLNQIIDALEGNIVMRNTSGVMTDGAGDIGKIASGRPDRVHVKTAITVGGQTLNTAPFLLLKTGVQSGAAKTSGYLNFLLPASGATATFDILGSATHLNMTIDGVAKSLEVDLTSDALMLAPGSNNTCVVNDAAFNDADWTSIFGEYGGRTISSNEHGEITIGTVGSEISALVGTIQVFKKGNELFLAYIKDATHLFILKRGISETNRETIDNADTITILKTHYIFLDNDLLTIDTSTVYPTWGPTAPAAPATGQYWWDTNTKTWKRYSGSTWEILGRIYLGYAICDTAGCQWVEHDDFDLSWADNIAGGDSYVYSNTQIILKSPLFCNVAGETIKIEGFKLVDITADLESGESETASTFYFLYIDKFGEFYLSTKKPRKPDQKKAWYHPQEYWRCIGVFYNDASSNLQRYNVSYIVSDFELTSETFTQTEIRMPQVPVGTILWWHKNFTGVPSILPIGWAECNGSVIADKRSTMAGQTLPDINGGGRFIRGSATSGTTQANANASHTHGISAISADVARSLETAGSNFGVKVEYSVNMTLDNALASVPASNTASSGTTEARPDNISMVAIMRIF